MWFVPWLAGIGAVIALWQHTETWWLVARLAIVAMSFAGVYLVSGLGKELLAIMLVRGEKQRSGAPPSKPPGLSSIMLIERPDDPVWHLVTRENVEKFQAGFLELEHRLGLSKLFSSRRIDDAFAEKMVEIVNEIEERNRPLHPAILLLLAHQYIDADQMMRQFYKSEWVVRMVARSDYAPRPEGYVEYLKERFFGGSFAP